MRGLRAASDCEFWPSRLSFNSLFGGHMQTILTAPKELAWHLMYGNYEYDKREVFKLSDGGQIHIDYKGEFFKPNSQIKKRKRGLVVLINGLSAHSQDRRFIPIVDQLYNGIDGMEGLDVININYRGLAGAKLTTARMYCVASKEDVIEPLLSIHKRYCKNSNQNNFVIGFSMGACVLGNALA